VIPYADINEAADRRWTLRLLERLVDPGLPDAERDDLVGALQAVSDPRSFAPLMAILADPAAVTPVREAAGSALRGMRSAALDLPEQTLRGWWLRGDAVLRRESLWCMGGLRCPDVVLRVASDPAHELQAAALERMAFFFDRPEHQAVKTAALSHSDAAVREAAAYAILWDEPVCAEGPLHRAASDTAAEVAAEAINALQYYPSLQTVRCLHGLAHRPDGKAPEEEARESLQSLRAELLFPLCGKDRRVADHVRRWLAPVWDLLAFTEDELRPDEDDPPPTRQEAARVAVPLAELLALLADPDASPLALDDRLRGNGWAAYSADERRRLRPVLLAHPDQEVRECAAAALADWGDADGLVALIGDGEFSVRKSAMYQLGQVPPSPGLADLAWAHLQRSDALGTHGRETLSTFVRHAAAAVARLEEVAADPGRRESLRVAAVGHLDGLGAAEAVSRLSLLLREPPAVTWALHLALLGALTRQRLPVPDVGHLRGVDNLHVQEALARLDVRGG
jgi:hypothetical protein